MTKNLLALGAVLAVTVATTSVAQAATSFTDVPSDHWAASAVSWAAEAGLMKGPDNMPGMFDPAGLANRAQLAVVMQRFYESMNAKMADLYSKIDELTKASNTTDNFGINMLEAGMLNKTFMVHLNGKQEVPPVSSNGAGTGYLMLSSEGLGYRIEVSSLAGSITGGQIHAGVIGVSGPARHSLKFTNGVASGIWRFADMTKEDLTMLLNGEMYVNVRSNSFGDGEIRGQIVMHKADLFHGKLSSAQEVGDVESSGSGMIHGALFGNDFVYMGAYKDLSTAFTMAHFHGAAIGENGGVLEDMSCDTAAMMCAGIWNMSDSEKASLWAGNVYANIHTSKYAGGELRAQMMMK